MKPRPAFQRRAAHRRRKAPARALHQILAMRHEWMAAWHRAQRRPGGLSAPPPRIKLPKMLKQHRVRLYRAFVRP